MQNLPFLCWIIPLLLTMCGLFYATRSSYLWSQRKITGKIAIALIFASMLFVGWSVNLTGIILFLLIQSWIVLLAARLSFGRLSDEFLQNSTRLNIILAAVSILAALIINWLGGYSILIVTALSLAVSVGLLMQILWTLRHFNLKSPESSSQKPTVSVCIPARNEDDALTDCLNAVLQSDYPKLEVLVLDDCSYDKTAQIIKSFAHGGVRFIKGDTPAEGWLGKTQAMRTLTQHANGEWLLFMGVDTKVSKQSISKIVAEATTANIKMLSILPQNLYSPGVSTVFSTLQYFWQIALPLSKKRVPISSKAWFIKAGSLKDLGGFESVKNKIMPEMSFARRLFDANQYRFFISSSNLGLTAAKRWPGQVKTSIRLAYPMFKRQPFYALFGVLAVGLFMLLPFVAMSFWYFMGNNLMFWINFLTSTILLLGYGLVLTRSQPKSWILAFIFLPVVLIQELALIIASIISYEFGEVNWKERNICYPVIAQGQRSKPLSTELLH